MKCFFLSNYKIKDMKLFDINNSSNRINNRHVIYFNTRGKCCDNDSRNEIETISSCV